MAVTRSEGYRRSRGKEERTLCVVRSCMREVLGIDPGFIRDPERNRTEGDIDCGSTTAECKGQPIDPDAYRNNFVEVMEDTTSTRKAVHRDGFARTSQILGLDPSRLAACFYTDRRTSSRRRVDALAYVSCSLESIAGSEITIYANSDPKRTFVYFYSREYLIAQIHDAVTRNRMCRGAGNSNQDTFGVFVPNSPARWQQRNGAWGYVGPGSPPLDRLRHLLQGA